MLGNLVATGCYLRYIVKHGTVLTIDLRPALKKPQMLGEMLAIGLPNGISSLLAGFASSFSNRLLVTHGTAAVAAMAAAGKTTMIISMIAMAICMGCQPLLAYSYGAGDTKRLKQLLKDLILLTVVFGVLAGAASFAGRNALIGMFIKEEGAFRLGTQLVIYLVLGSPVIGLTYLATSLLQSVGRASGAVVLFAAGAAADPAAVPDECALRGAGHCGGAPDGRRGRCGHLCRHPAALAPGIGRKNGRSMIYCFHQ